MASFSMVVEGFPIELRLYEVELLKPHEEVVESLLQHLIDDIKSSQVMRDPVIVDKETFVVLDGMHRLEAAKRLGLKSVPVCLVDYRDPRIEVKRWTRILSNSSNVLSLARSKYRVRERESLLTVEEDLESLKAFAALLCGTRVFAISANEPIPSKKHSYDMLYSLEGMLKESGVNIRYQVEGTQLEAASVVLFGPRLTKEDVVETVSKGLVFAPKATRHVIPLRPINVSVSTELLRSSKADEANEIFVQHLERRRFKVLEPGSTIAGRFYEEAVLFFE